MEQSPATERFLSPMFGQPVEARQAELGCGLTFVVKLCDIIGTGPDFTATIPPLAP